MKEIIKIQEDVIINEKILLEKGDIIEILNESKTKYAIKKNGSALNVMEENSVIATVSMKQTNDCFIYSISGWDIGMEYKQGIKIVDFTPRVKKDIIDAIKDFVKDNSSFKTVFKWN